MSPKPRAGDEQTVTDFDRIWAHIHLEECGQGAAVGKCEVVNHPKDPGGPTIHGVAKNYWPALWKDGAPTVEAARELFFQRFWLPCHCGELGWPLNLVVADWAYLAGEDNPALALQRAAGLPSADQDGDIGPATVEAVRAWAWRLAAEAVLKRRYREVLDNPRRKEFPGWFRRITRVARLAGVLDPATGVVTT